MFGSWPLYKTLSAYKSIYTSFHYYFLQKLIGYCNKLIKTYKNTGKYGLEF